MPFSVLWEVCNVHAMHDVVFEFLHRCKWISHFDKQIWVDVFSATPSDFSICSFEFLPSMQFRVDMQFEANTPCMQINDFVCGKLSLILAAVEKSKFWSQRRKFVRKEFSLLRLCFAKIVIWTKSWTETPDPTKRLEAKESWSGFSLMTSPLESELSNYFVAEILAVKIGMRFKSRCVLSIKWVIKLREMLIITPIGTFSKHIAQCTHMSTSEVMNGASISAESCCFFH